MLPKSPSQADLPPPFPTPSIETEGRAVSGARCPLTSSRRLISNTRMPVFQFRMSTAPSKETRAASKSPLSLWVSHTGNQITQRELLSEEEIRAGALAREHKRSMASSSERRRRRPHNKDILPLDMTKQISGTQCPSPGSA